MNQVARKVLDAEQAPAEVAPRDGDRLIPGVVVNQVCLDALAEEVFQTRGDEPLLVVSRQNCYHAHIRALRESLDPPEPSALKNVESSRTYYGSSQLDASNPRPELRRAFFGLIQPAREGGRAVE